MKNYQIKTPTEVTEIEVKPKNMPATTLYTNKKACVILCIDSTMFSNYY